LGVFFAGSWTLQLIAHPHTRSPVASSIAASWWLCLAGVAATNVSALHLLWLMPCVAMLSVLGFAGAFRRAMRESWARGDTIYSYASGLSLAVSNAVVLALVLSAIWATPRLLPTWLTATALSILAVFVLYAGLLIIAQTRRVSPMIDKLLQGKGATDEERFWRGPSDKAM